MKRRIKLNETELKRTISESVRRVIKEGVKDGNLEQQFDDIYGDWDPCGQFDVTHEDVYADEKAGMGDKEKDNLASWRVFDGVNSGINAQMKSKANKAYFDRSYEKPFSRSSYYGDDYGSKNEYLDSRDYKRNEFGGWMDDFQKDLHKQWQDTKDKEKYTRQADSRHLHRKGSLNRAMDESKLNRIVSESVRMVLRETKLKGGFSDLFIPNHEQHIPKKEKRKWEDEGRKQDHERDRKQAEYLRQKGFDERHPQPYKVPDDYYDFEQWPCGQ